MKCKKCKSENLQVVKSGPHNKLICIDCLAFQKFLSASELKIFKELQATNQSLQSDGEGDAVYCCGCGFTHKPGKCPDGLNGRR